MRKSSMSLSALLAMVALGAGVAPSVSAPGARATQASAADQPATQAVAASSKQIAVPQSWKERRHTTRRYPALGWSVMHDRRLARKRRNRAANRKAHRG